MRALAEMIRESSELGAARSLSQKAGNGFFGGLLAAGDLYRQLEEYERAGECYTRQGEHDQAAEMYRVCGDRAKAAESYENAGRFTEAAECYALSGRGDREAELLEKAEDYLGAEHLLKELQGFVNILNRHAYVVYVVHTANGLSGHR